MASNYVQTGEIIQYTNETGSTITADTPIAIGDMVGVALLDIADDETGSVGLSGVWELPKEAEIIAQGAKVYLNSSGKITATSTANTFAGIMFEAAASGDATCYVKLCQTVKGDTGAKGDYAVLAYTNGTGSTIDEGDAIAIGTIVGVALEDIAAAAEGDVGIEGIYTIAKSTDVAITLGAAVYLIAASGLITTVAESNVYAGRAVSAALEAGTTVDVLLNV